MLPQAFRQIGCDAPVSFSLSGFFSASSSSSLQFNNRQSSKLCLLSEIIKREEEEQKPHLFPPAPFHVQPADG
jgi:hypothetical protein